MQIRQCVRVCVSVPTETTPPHMCIRCTYIHTTVTRAMLEQAIFFLCACGQCRRVYCARASPLNEIISKSRARSAPASQYSLSSLLVLNEVV